MDSATEPQPARGGGLIIAGLLTLLALYLVAYFPAFSYMTRHPEHQRYSALYRPIPQPSRGWMLRAWLKLDHGGADIFNRAIEEQRAAGRIP